MHLNPYAGAYLDNPAIVWRELLDNGPGVRYAEDLQLWLITGYDDVRRVLADSKTFSNAMTVVPTYPMCPEAIAILAEFDVPPTTIGADSPAHDRARAALQAAVGNTRSRVTDRYGPIVVRRADQLIDRIAAQPGHTVDLVPHLTAELPLLVISDVLGLPEQDVPRIKGWSEGQVELIWGHPDEAEQASAARRIVEFWRYCKQLVGTRSEAGDHGEDVIGRLLAYRNGDDEVLTEAEAASLVFNLLIAGHETTSGLLAHAVEYALTEPARWRRVVAEPAMIPAYVEETLRYGPAIDGWLRITTAPVTIGGTPIPAGARCLLLIGAANRDGSVFADPDLFDIDRPNNMDHLSFGYGSHFCIGAALARFEARVMLERLTSRVPDLRMGPYYASAYRPNIAIRNLKSLPVTVGSAPAYQPG